jgi:hypothetical protein
MGMEKNVEEELLEEGMKMRYQISIK